MPHDAPPEDHTAPAPVRLTAADVMTPGPRTCSPFSTVVEAAMIFRDSDCGAVPVLDEGKPVGILTDRDVALALTEHPDLATRPVADVMTKDVITVFADTPLAALREKFGEVKVRRLLVIDPDGGLRGIVAWSDLAAHLPEREVGHVVSEVIERPDAGGTAGQEGRALTRPGDEGDQDRPAGGSRWAWAKPAAFWGLLRTTASEWMEDKVPRLGAALAFYSVLSIAPLLIIAIAIAALAFGEEAARGQLVGQMRGMVGPEGADAIQEMIKNARKPATGTVAALLGVVTLLFGASGVFGQLQDAINTIWEVQPKPGRGVLAMLKDRFLSFAMVLGTGFLLLVSLVLSAALAAFFALAARPGPRPWGGAPGGEHPRVVHRRRRALRADLQAPAGREDRLAGRLGWRGADDGPVPGRQGPHRPVPGPERLRLGLRGGGLAGGALGLDLLLGADPVLRGGVHAGLRQPLRLADRAGRGRRAGHGRGAGPAGHPQGRGRPFVAGRFHPRRHIPRNLTGFREAGKPRDRPIPGMKFALCVVSFAQLFVPSSATLFVTLLHSVTYGVVPYTPSVVNSPGQIDREIGRCRSNFSTALLNPTFRTSRVNYSLQPVALLEISVSIYPSEGEKPALRKSFAFKRLQQMCGTWVREPQKNGKSRTKTDRSSRALGDQARLQEVRKTWCSAIRSGLQKACQHG